MSVWQRGRWDWAYQVEPRTGVRVFGCGFSNRRDALEAAREAMAKYERGAKSSQSTHAVLPVDDVEEEG